MTRANPFATLLDLVRRPARLRLDAIVAGAGIQVPASHDIGLIQSACNRAILLEEGRDHCGRSNR